MTKTLRTRFLLRIVLIVGVLMLLGAVVSIVGMQDAAIEALERRGRVLAETQSIVLSGPVWDLNYTAATQIVQALTEDPDLAYASLVDDTGQEIVSVTGPIGREGAIVFTVPIEHEFAEGPLGVLTLEMGVDRIRSALIENWILLGTQDIAILFLVVFLVYWSFRGVAGPMMTFATLIREVASGDTQSVIPYQHRRDEIGEIARSLKTLMDHEAERIDLMEAERRATESLKRVNEELERRVRERTAKLEEEIAQRKQTEDDLRDAKYQADSANRAKSEFLANMSHELRTPLNAIIGISEFVLEDLQDEGADEEIIESVSRVLRAGQNLLALINDILDLSKIEAGRMELAPESVAIRTAVDEVTGTVQVLAERNGNTLEVDIEDTVERIDTDPMRLRQVLLNLLSNACKFTENGSIRLSVFAESYPALGAGIAFEVTDSGIGMTEEQVRNLFQSFSQADTGVAKKYGGTGLGLAISRRLARIMGGDIFVTSTQGVGSTFTLFLPEKTVRRGDGDEKGGAAAAGLAKTEAVPTPASVVAMRSLEKALEEGPSLDDDGQSEIGASSNARAGGEAEVLPMQRGRILIIDDDPVFRKLLTAVLSPFGHKVAYCRGGVDGLREIRHTRPDLVILDIMMPELSGWDVLAAIRADSTISDIPVLITTASNDRRRAIQMGATDFLEKPTQPSEILQIVNAAMPDGPVGSRLVLVVDDNSNDRYMLRNTMESAGWVVVEAADGKEGLHRLETLEPDLIVLDLNMPNMSGFEFIDALDQKQAERHVPIIVFTGQDLSKSERQTLDRDISFVIEKGPNSQKRLLRDIEKLLTSELYHHDANAFGG